MVRTKVLVDRHQALADKFAELAQARGQHPVFAIEHGLDELVLEELRGTVSEHLEEDPQLSGAAWSWSYLPLVVIATEVGYRYRGTGTDFWPILSQEIGVDASLAFRSGLSKLFELAHHKFHLARPGDSPWELHFPHIAWPIGNSVVPLEIQPQLTDALRRAVRAGITADETEPLLEYIRALAAGHASRRFENWLMRKDLALEVMRRLLSPGTSGWLSEGILIRIDRDIRKDWGAFRAITEARKAVARRAARLAQIAPARFGLALRDDVPSQSFIRGPVLPSNLRDDVIASLRIHGDRIRAVDGIQAISLGSFLSGGEISLGKLFPFHVSPLRRDDSLDVSEGQAGVTLQKLQPLQSEFFVVEHDGKTASAVLPTDLLQPDSAVIQCLRVDEAGILETRRLDTSSPTDVEFLRRRGYVIADRIPKLQLLGMTAPGSTHTFLGGFPVLVTARGIGDADLLLDGLGVSGEVVTLRGVRWRALRPNVGRHTIEPADGPEFDRIEFEIVDPADIEPAAVKMFPAHANASDLEAGQLEIRVTAPLALEGVPIRIKVNVPNEPFFSCEGLIERLPARITGRSPILNAIQTRLAGLQAGVSGIRMTVEVAGLCETVFSLPPVRREFHYEADTEKWTRIGDDSSVLPSLVATIEAPLLTARKHETRQTQLVLPKAPDYEALTAGIVISGRTSNRLGFGDQVAASLPPLLREPASNKNGVGLVEIARSYVAWQLSEANDLLGNWQRWSTVEALEVALIDQLCGPTWRRLEAGIDLSILSPHGGLFRSAHALGLVSGKDLPSIETASDRDFLRQRLISRFREAVPVVPDALLQWDDDLAGELDLAVIDAYEDLRQHLEARGIAPFDEVDMSRPAEIWRVALEQSREIQFLPMFRPYILPDSRWSALIKPYYGELTEDDLVDLLDSVHTDAFRRPGLRWLGRAELRTMLQLWLSPKAMIETEGWRELLAKGLSDLRTTRAVRYVALRQKLALGDLPEGSAN